MFTQNVYVFTKLHGIISQNATNTLIRILSSVKVQQYLNFNTEYHLSEIHKMFWGLPETPSCAINKLSLFLSLSLSLSLTYTHTHTNMYIKTVKFVYDI